MNDMVLRGADLNQQYGTTAKETFNETILGNMYNDLTSFQELHNKTAEAMKLTLDGVNEAYDQWQEDVSDVMDLAGTSVEDFGKLVDREAIKINEITGGIAENTEKMKDRMSTAFDQTLTAAGNFANNYGLKLASIKEAND
jgi:plasmid maintenance system antidote protein VapI